MEFKVGEKVRFLHDKSEGVIQRILKKGEVEVLIDDFVEMIVSVGDLVKIDRGEKNLRETAEEKETAEKEPQSISTLPAELVIIRKDGFFEMWILNPGDLDIYYTLHLKIRNRIQALNAGIVDPQEHVFAAKLEKGEFFDSKTLYIQVLRYRSTREATVYPPLHLEIPVKVKVLKQTAVPIEELKAEGHRFRLEDTQPETTAEAADADPRPDPNPTYTAPPEVVDLHIEKLVDSPLGLNSDTMLQIQVEHFEKLLAAAVLHKKNKIVFIHGIGTGRLKKAIHRRLEENQFVRKYGLADPNEYGNGATVVEFA